MTFLELTFKPNTDDMRAAPSIAITQTLIDAGPQVTAYDPDGMAMAKVIMPEFAIAQTSLKYTSVRRIQ